jgi:uncharacterized Zn finger protein
MKSDNPPITQGDIERWVGSASFRKGLRYYRQGMIFKARIRGQAVQSRCHGSRAASYQVQATLGRQQIQSADCSCPVGAGGRCKHVAALLLTWLNDPDSFQESETLEATLEKRSKAELIALIRLMLEREPDLEIFLDMPLPGTASSREPLDPEVIRKQVEHAFDNPYDDWGWADPYDVVRSLKPLFDLASQNIDQENYENAATIYQEVADIVLNYSDAIMQDENGRLGGVLRNANAGSAFGTNACASSFWIGWNQRGSSPSKVTAGLSSRFILTTGYMEGESLCPANPNPVEPALIAVKPSPNAVWPDTSTNALNARKLSKPRQPAAGRWRRSGICAFRMPIVKIFGSTWK